MHKKAILLLTASALLLASDSHGGEPDKDRLFRRVVQPGGWAIPKHGKRVETGSLRPVGLPEGVTLVQFDASKSTFVLPRHYVDNGLLVLSSLRFRADTITRLDAGGRPYAWFMLAIGADTGLAADVWIVDREGEGIFDEVEWNPTLSRLPAWAAKRIEAESSKSRQ